MLLRASRTALRLAPLRGTRAQLEEVRERGTGRDGATTRTIFARTMVQRTGDAALKLKELHLVSEAGISLGVMAPKEALAVARERDLTLTEVRAAAEPPVWKLMTAAALAPPVPTPAPPTEKRREKAAKPPKEKELRLTDSIAPRDAEHKVATALKFLDKGHVVKVLVLNQGKRDPEDKEKALAVTIVEQVCKACEEVANVSDVQGSTGLRAAGETNITRQILGPVFATLTPKGGGARQTPTPRARQKEREGEARGGVTVG